MSYIGPPLVYGFTIMGTGCGLIATHAAATIGRVTYWMGLNGFWMFGDSGVQPLPCSVWDQIFPNLDTANQIKCFAGANSSFHEVWFFFPSAGGGGECDSYVKFNAMENLWDFGSLVRSAWTDNNVFGGPLAGDGNFLIQQHEIGYDADNQPMDGVFAEAGYANIQDGDEIMFIDQIIPDLKWFGNNGSVNITLKTVAYPGSAPNSFGPYSMTPTTEFFSVRARARQVAMRLDWANYPGFSARAQAIRFRLGPAGKRP
jgi:hypothetical protein